jgi:hypothetical protein
MDKSSLLLYAWYAVADVSAFDETNLFRDLCLADPVTRCEFSLGILV